MILLSFKKGQGLGNQLWNYVVLRSVAEYNNYKFKLINHELFLGKEFLVIEKNNTNEEFDKNSINYYKEKLIYDTDLKCFIHRFDQEIINISDNTMIEGNLQSEEYLKPSIEIINKYINLKDKTNNLSNVNNTCLLNIRGGEYKLHKNLILPKSYWLNAMKNMRHFNNKIEFKIITDDVKYASKLLPNIEILKGGVKQDFMNLYFCKYAILSNSSFGYFPIKLGQPPNFVIAPYQWSRFGNNYNRWVSPANYYSDWFWQDKNGQIKESSDIEESINISTKTYSRYNLLTNEHFFKKKSLKDFIPINIKKFLKKFLSNLFPLHIG